MFVNIVNGSENVNKKIKIIVISFSYSLVNLKLIFKVGF